MGNSVGHPQGIREGSAPTPRARHDDAPANLGRDLGGQAGGAGVFGCHGSLRFHAARQAQGTAGTPTALPPTRVKGALTPQATDGLSPAHYTGAPARHTLTIRCGTFAAFVRLSEHEQRPVEDVMGEWLADCAALICSQETANEFDGYGLGCASTSAMRAAAAASDTREDREWHQRAALLEDGHGPHPALVEFTLNLEGE